MQIYPCLRKSAATTVDTSSPTNRLIDGLWSCSLVIFKIWTRAKVPMWKNKIMIIPIPNVCIFTYNIHHIYIYSICIYKYYIHILHNFSTDFPKSLRFSTNDCNSLSSKTPRIAKPQENCLTTGTSEDTCISSRFQKLIQHFAGCWFWSIVLQYHGSSCDCLLWGNAAFCALQLGIDTSPENV